MAPPPEASGTRRARTRVTRVAMSDLNVTAPPFAPPDSNRVDVPARDNHVAPHPPTPTRDIEGVRGDDDSRIRRPGAGHHRRRGDARGEGELRAGPRALPAAHVHARAGGAARTPARAGGSGRREEKGAAGREFEFNGGAVREAARRRRHRAAAAAAAATDADDARVDGRRVPHALPRATHREQVQLGRRRRGKFISILVRSIRLTTSCLLTGRAAALRPRRRIPRSLPVFHAARSGGRAWNTNRRHHRPRAHRCGVTRELLRRRGRTEGAHPRLLSRLVSRPRRRRRGARRRSERLRRNSLDAWSPP